MIEVLKKEYDGESIADLGRDIHEALDSSYNPVFDLIPVDAYGFQKGTFTVSIVWSEGNPVTDKIMVEQQEVTVPEIIEAVANFVGSQKGGPFTPEIIKAAIIGQLKYGGAFTKLVTSPAPSYSQQPTPDVPALVEALEEARLTLEVMQGRGSSAELTLAIIDRVLDAYRKGDQS